MRGRSPLIILALLVVASSAGLGLVTADSTAEYSVEATTSIDTPERTISVQGDDYEVSSIGKIGEGQMLRASVSRPGDDRFTVSLYNTDQRIEDSVSEPDNGTYSFDTDSLDPGTYVLALDVDGIDGFQDIQPVVVSGHDFDVDAPETVSESDQISITAAVTDNPQQVDVVLFNESWQRTVTADGPGDGEYNAVIDENLAPGEYSFYLGVRGEESFNGERVLTGISSSHSVTVEGDTEPTTSAPTTEGGTPTEPATATATSTANQTTPGSSTTARATTQSSVNATTSKGASTPGRTTDANTQTTVEQSTVATTDESEPTNSVITPNTPSLDESTTETTTPGFTVVTAILAGLVLIWRQR